MKRLPKPPKHPHRKERLSVHNITGMFPWDGALVMFYFLWNAKFAKSYINLCAFRILSGKIFS